MLVSTVVFCALVCSISAIQYCFPELLYEMTNDFTANEGSGYVEITPVGSITTNGKTAMVTAEGALKFYRLSANDWRGDNLISFTFLPNDTSLDTDIGVMSNSLASDTGSFMVSWCGNEVMLKVILQVWNVTTFRFESRTEVLTISDVAMDKTQSVRITIQRDEIQFQTSPLIGGGIPEPISLSLKHDEHIKIVGWDPLTFGAGTPVEFVGQLGEFAYFKCIPVDAFELYKESNFEETTTNNSTLNNSTTYAPTTEVPTTAVTVA